MSHALVLGKFLPPHRGHHRLIDEALAGCDRVTVLVLASERERLPLDLRLAWLRERHPAANVVGGYDEHPIDFDDPAVWDLHMAVIEPLLFAPVSHVFAGEAYGAELARRLGARAVLVDRREDGRSASAVRADPRARWDDLDPVVQAGLQRRVAIVGAESTGTTTLAAALAAEYGTAWVAEHGRAYSENRTPGPWRDEEFVAIALRQQADEDAAALTAGPVLFCDTDALATCVWQERYMGRSTPEVEALAAARGYDLYVLTGDEIPFVQDGLRDGEHLRPWMTERFRARLRERPEPWIEVRGAPGERIAAARVAVDTLLTAYFDP